LSTCVVYHCTIFQNVQNKQNKNAVLNCNVVFTRGDRRRDLRRDQLPVVNTRGDSRDRSPRRSPRVFST